MFLFLIMILILVCINKFIVDWYMGLGMFILGLFFKWFVLELGFVKFFIVIGLCMLCYCVYLVLLLLFDI